MQNGSPRRGIHSVETAARILRVLAAEPASMALSELARAAHMPASKVHRYLGSLINAGLVTQDAGTGRYDLGPFALEMGIAALARFDPVNSAADSLRALALATGATAMLSVWGTHGATVVRWERGGDFLVTSLGLGSVLPLIGSATGNVFLAYLPERVTLAALESERAAMREACDIAPIIERTRSAGFAAADGNFIPGLAAVAAPLLNWQGEADAAITLMVPTASTERLQSAVPLLLDTCHRLSRGSEQSATFP